MRFVISVAKQYQNQGLSLPDLINEGNIGLIKAARRFDETRGFKFISFAVWWIRQSILQALAEKSRIVRLPLNQVGAINKLKKVSSRLEQQLERAPSDEELAEEMDLSFDKIKETSHIGAKADYHYEGNSYCKRSSCVSLPLPLYLGRLVSLGKMASPPSPRMAQTTKTAPSSH